MCDCCDTFAEHLRSLRFHAQPARPKRTVDHTDTAVVTTTERSLERQDVTVSLRNPIRGGS